MSLRTLSQVSFFDPEFVMPSALTPGTLPWLLARHRSMVLPSWLFKGWRGELVLGRDAWPAPVLMTLALLRWTGEGMSRLRSTEVAKSDAVWRAALGLQFGAPTPTEKTMREFERFLRLPHPDTGTPRYLVAHEHFVRLCTDAGIGGKEAVWGTDSTPMWCYGAVLDTVRLLGDGVRKLAALWARARDEGVIHVAKRWDLSAVVAAKSTKGGLGIDWRDADARAVALDSLARAVIVAVEEVQQQLQGVARDKRRQLLRLAQRLLLVISQNLEADEKGRLVVAQRVASGRIASLTDPEARHGRKSASQTYTGFKIHLLGDCVSGLIASLTVTHGSQHDATVTPRLVRRAHQLLAGFETLLADTAYGGAELRHELARFPGVHVLAPPPVGGHVEGRLPKQDFAVDFEAMTATCPNGVTTAAKDDFWSDEHQRTAWRFRWDRATCGVCPLRDQCLGKGRRSKELKLHPFERELRKAREDWAEPAVREAYRQRGQHERLIHQLVRHGARRARGWGMGSANLQAHAIAMSANLTLLAQRLAEMEERIELRSAA